MKNILVLLGLFLLVGCGPSYFFEQKKDIPNGVWTWRDSLDFVFEIKDTTAIYNLYLDVKAKDSYPNENIYLKLFTGFPDGHRLEYTRSFNVFDTKGALIGKRSGSAATQQFVLQENAFFSTPGSYKITVQQFLRLDSIEGIESIGLAVQKTEQKR